jgi:hypothetical protein
MRDFTLLAYQQLLETLKAKQLPFYTFEEVCENKPSVAYVVLRHDVDDKPKNSLRVAQLEAELGIKATYYFRIVEQSNQPEIIKAIVALGHEIGYHYEDLSLCKGNTEKAFQFFQKNLGYFRTFYPVRTICMHGSPTSRFDNRELWKQYSYRELGIIGEPYLDFLEKEAVIYFTDTGRCWDGEKFNRRDKIQKTETNFVMDKKIHSTADLTDWIKQTDIQQPIMITTHPQRWTNFLYQWGKEYCLQSAKNVVKRFLIACRKE